MIIGAVILLVAALAFVAAELVVPSHGLLAVCAVVAAVASTFLAYQASPMLGLLFAGVTVISAPVAFYWAIKLYPNTPVGRRILLNNPTNAAGTPFAGESAKLGELVGQQGVALTLLRPTGAIDINGQRIDAVSESEMIPAGTKVEILRVSGLKVIVKPVVG